MSLRPTMSVPLEASNASGRALQPARQCSQPGSAASQAVQPARQCSQPGSAASQAVHGGNMLGTF